MMKTVAANEATNLFRTKFGHTPTFAVRAPGRLELIGNHTDYNQGLVMSLAVDKHIDMASSARTDGKIELVSSAFPEAETFTVSDIVKNPQKPYVGQLREGRLCWNCGSETCGVQRF